MLRYPCYITDFCVVRPDFEAPQPELCQWLAEAHFQAERQKNALLPDSFLEEVKEKLTKIGVGPDRNQTRGIHIPDFLHQNWEGMKIFRLLEDPQGLGLKERSEFFATASEEIFDRFYPEGAKLPAHLVHVTCTGYVAPSAAQKLVAKRKAGKNTVVTHAYHMGCYAALPALRMAAGFLANGSTSADIVHTEICSLHLNPLLHDTGQLVVHTLFADGFIKYKIEEKSQGKSFKILSLVEETIEESIDQMSWVCEDWGFRMKLAKEVPVLIAKALPSFIERLTSHFKIDLKTACFAIHPGGVKIIQQVAKILHLEKKQYEHSQNVLENYGNMSSATLPHIWDKILKDDTIPALTPVISVAFGPGLSLSGALFIKEA